MASRQDPAQIVDADDTFEDFEEAQWQGMLDAGFSEEHVQAARQRKAHAENVALYTMMEKQLGGGVDRFGNTADFLDAEQEEAECEEMDMEAFKRGDDAGTVGCKLAEALEGLGRRNAAIQALERAVKRVPRDGRVALHLAKLLFRANRKEEAMKACQTVIQCHQQVGQGTSSDLDLADAYYIMGWIAIHADDHHRAYTLWGEGSVAVPDDARLRKQWQKRQCWDYDPFSAPPELQQQQIEQEQQQLQGLFGDCALPEHTRLVEMTAAGGATSSTSSDVDDGGACGIDAFSIPEGFDEPALALFRPQSQGRNVVFRTQFPLMSHQECAAVLAHAEAHATARGGWGTVRHSSVRTTDVAVEDVEPLQAWLRSLVRQRVAPLLHRLFPQLADGSGLGGGGRVRVHDAFIVRYDATRDGSVRLPAHRDTSVFSATIALNARSSSSSDGEGRAFEGGGTWFEALAPDAGGCVVDAEEGQAVFFAGPLRHAGQAVTAGTRVILVLFMYVENFAYGELLTDALHKQQQQQQAEGGGGQEEGAGYKSLPPAHMFASAAAGAAKTGRVDTSAPGAAAAPPAAAAADVPPAAPSQPAAAHSSSSSCDKDSSDSSSSSISDSSSSSIENSDKCSSSSSTGGGSGDVPQQQQEEQVAPVDDVPPERDFVVLNDTFILMTTLDRKL